MSNALPAFVTEADARENPGRLVDADRVLVGGRGVEQTAAGPGTLVSRDPQRLIGQNDELVE